MNSSCGYRGRQCLKHVTTCSLFLKHLLVICNSLRSSGYELMAQRYIGRILGPKLMALRTQTVRGILRILRVALHVCLCQILLGRPIEWDYSVTGYLWCWGKLVQELGWRRAHIALDIVVNSSVIVLRGCREVVYVSTSHVCHQVNLCATIILVLIRFRIVLAQSLLPEVKGAFFIAASRTSARLSIRVLRGYPSVILRITMVMGIEQLALLTCRTPEIVMIKISLLLASQRCESTQSLMKCWQWFMSFYVWLLKLKSVLLQSIFQLLFGLHWSAHRCSLRVFIFCYQTELSEDIKDATLTILEEVLALPNQTLMLICLHFLQPGV